MPPRAFAATLLLIDGPIAQWLEQATHNRLVGGSNPSGPTNSPWHGFIPKDVWERRWKDAMVHRVRRWGTKADLEFN
ncbi:hypothetical protein SBV1_1940017 [Verrucomicrobia bacterium]|nr:hypothetical protein SBV1_1940017 [Verrucomicrobiota bacterium]